MKTYYDLSQHMIPFIRGAIIIESIEYSRRNNHGQVSLIVTIFNVIFLDGYFEHSQHLIFL